MLAKSLKIAVPCVSVAIFVALSPIATVLVSNKNMEVKTWIKDSGTSLNFEQWISEGDISAFTDVTTNQGILWSSFTELFWGI